MNLPAEIPGPIIFNPLKHHLGFIKDFTESCTGNLQAENCVPEIVRELRHTGTSVMDVYTGSMTIGNICSEVKSYLENNSLDRHDAFIVWAGRAQSDFRVITLSDESQWILKYHSSTRNYVHIFPARQSPHTFRIKSNTLKSAILYVILIGKNYVTDDDLNKARAVAGLSPVREAADTEAVAEMIEVLRN